MISSCEGCAFRRYVRLNARALPVCAGLLGSAASLSVAGCSDARPPMRSAGNRGGCHYHAACSRRAASSKPALWPLIIVPIVLPRIVVLAAAPERIVETPATPAKAEVATEIGRAHV